MFLFLKTSLVAGERLGFAGIYQLSMEFTQAPIINYCNLINVTQTETRYLRFLSSLMVDQLLVVKKNVFRLRNLS